VKAWVVNDCLTCIPGTETFWHDLLRWFPFMEDKTFGSTPYDQLADKIEREIDLQGPPDVIVRNASYFRRLRREVKTISLLQDYIANDPNQIDVCSHSSVVVFNSPFTKSLYPQISTNSETIVLGTDFDLFRPLPDKESLRLRNGVLPNSILFVGSQNAVKGFEIVLELIRNTKFNFCLVMKDNFSMNHPRVRVFSKINHTKLVEVINACKMLICTSRVETLHLAGVEAAACDLPLLTTNVGVYHNRPAGLWGQLSSGQWQMEIQSMLLHLDRFSPRQYFLEEGYDKHSCKLKWGELIGRVINE
jgi:glycosyltransferase involved in cell wall biosynthesis